MADDAGRPWHSTLLTLAAVMTYILVASGGLVCITDASTGCPDWPACHGRLIPPAQMDSIIEYSHRVGAALTLPLILAALIVAWRRHRAARWVFRPVLGAVGGLLLVAWFGAAGAFWGLNRGWAATDLGAALLTLALMVTAAVALRLRRANPAAAPRLSLSSPFSRLAAATLVGVFFVLVSGVLVARPHSLVRCIGWPRAAGLAAPADLLGWLQLLRLGLSGLVGLSVLALAVQAWRTQRGRPALVRGAGAAAVLLLSAAALAALRPSPDAGIVVPVLGLLSTEGLWAVLVAVTARAALEAPPRSVAS